MKKQLFGKGLVLLGALACAVMVMAAEEKPAAEIDVAVGIAEGVPGGVTVTTLAIQAKVVEINYETRELGLLMPGGAVTKIVVGPEAINFKQVKKGDIVKALVTEEVVVRMGSVDAELADGEAAAVVAAPEGEMPGGVAIDTVHMTAVVVVLDGISRTATLMFEDGTMKTVGVRDDIDLTKHRLGEKVVFEITEMVAISVEKQKTN